MDSIGVSSCQFEKERVAFSTWVELGVQLDDEEMTRNEGRNRVGLESRGRGKVRRKKSARRRCKRHSNASQSIDPPSITSGGGDEAWREKEKGNKNDEKKTIERKSTST